MTDHPITPPDELVEQWWHDATGTTYQMIEYIATQAARWGADQELEACCEWVEREIGHGREWNAKLRAAMRPKPPILKQQTISELQSLAADLISHGLGCYTDTIRRALEALSDE